MNTLEQYLKAAFQNNVIDHVIRAQVNSEGVVTFYIHPLNVSGKTLDFQVSENTLKCLTLPNK